MPKFSVVYTQVVRVEQRCTVDVEAETPQAAEELVWETFPEPPFSSDRWIVDDWTVESVNVQAVEEEESAS